MSKVKCLSCGATLESKHRYDFQKCMCENETFIDGGNDYIRSGGKDLGKVFVLTDQKMSYKELCNNLENIRDSLSDLIEILREERGK